MRRPTPLREADLRAYEALSTGCSAFVRTTDLHHLEFAGPKSADTLNGLVTNDVLTLKVGDGQLAAALTAKGRIVADMRIVRIESERYLTTTNAAAWPGWRDLVRKFVNPRLAKYSESSRSTIALHGPAAHAHAARIMEAFGVQSALAGPSQPYHCTRIQIEGAEILAIESPALGEVPGIELLVPTGLDATTLGALGALIAEGGVVTGTAAAWEVARVEAGRPVWGRDMDDTTIPQEANLGEFGALSFNKGCYTGQEVVARIHFRGHVNRHLRVLSSKVSLPEAAEIQDASGKTIGDVRTSVISPSLGPLAIAMVRRETGPGESVSVVVGGEAVQALVRS